MGVNSHVLFLVDCHGHLRSDSHGAFEGLERNLILMLWALCMSDLLLDLNLDCLPLGLVMSHCAPTMGWSFAISLALLLWPTISTKMIFISTLVTFLAECWAFSGWMRFAAFTLCFTCATLGSEAIAFLEFEGLWFHWLLMLLQFHHWTCVCWSLFTVISCTLWHAGGGLGMWHPLTSYSIWPISWLQNALSYKKATLSYVPFSQPLCCIGIFLWGVWYINLTDLSTHVLPVWCHCTSHQCGSSMRLTLLEYLQMALKTASGSFWVSSSFEDGQCVLSFEPFFT